MAPKRGRSKKDEDEQGDGFERRPASKHVLLTPVSPGSDLGELIHLPHPRDQQDAVFQLQGGRVLELHSMTMERGSWFIDDSVVADGSLLVATPVDPLLLLLPALEFAEASQGNKFLQLDDILSSAPHASYARLRYCHALDAARICQVKQFDADLVVYRLDKDKVLAWLAGKVAAIAEHLPSIPHAVDTDASASSALASAQRGDNAFTPDQLKRTAVGMLGEYVGAKWIRLLRRHLGIPAESQDLGEAEDTEIGQDEPSAKRQRTTTPAAATTEDAAAAAAKHGTHQDFAARSAELRAKQKTAGVRRRDAGAKKLSSSGKQQTSLASFFSAKSSS